MTTAELWVILKKLRQKPTAKNCTTNVGKGKISMMKAYRTAAAAISVLLTVMLACSCANKETLATVNTGAENSVLIFCIAGGIVLATVIIISALLLKRKSSAKKTAPPTSDSSIIGDRQPTPAEQPAVSAIFCKDCGAKMEEGAKFCISCGAKQD